MNHQFIRMEMLFGHEAMERLAHSHVIIFGVGGVGSYVAECLARSGVGELTLVDSDTVALSNLNRQIQALHSTLGQNKVDAVAQRCLDINPHISVHPICGLYNAENRDLFWQDRYDYVADCIDLVSCKLDLILQAKERNIPIISALGTGNKLDPSQLQITDISKTFGCPLARVMRKELRARGVDHLQVVFSPEEAAPTEQLETPPPGRRSIPASVPWVPSCAGLMMGGAIVRTLTENKEVD
ncbi:MAG: tRNA threonylcarbamoyladenosine dehydratase [Oscillospiraceae bacterium]|nr:tRNA threonylcarbamoyladenosine dehydratase [Oscillospiraceae bacterium]